MSSTPESSAESNPAALKFAEKRDGTDTRGGAGVVAAIIAAIALVAAGVTAAVVLSHKPASTQPPGPVLPPSMTKAGAAGGPLAGLQRIELVSSSTTLAGGQTLIAAGSSVQLGDSGVSFDVPTGWSVAKEEDGFAAVVNQKVGGSFLVNYGTVEGQNVDAKKVQAALFTKVTSGMSNLQTDGADGGALKPELQKNFDSLATQQFTGELTSQQGSTSVYGAAITLFNSGENSKIKTPAGFFAFMLLVTQDEASFKEAGPDMMEMVTGILGATPSA
jgi:hypothetical protein